MFTALFFLIALLSEIVGTVAGFGSFVFFVPVANRKQNQPITQVDLNRAVLRRWNSESVVAVGFTDADASIGQLHRQYLQ
jgi:hypothetical protein